VEIGAAASPDDDLHQRGSWDDPIRGTPDQIAAGLRRYRDLGIDHIQVQLRPNRLASVEAFAPVLAVLRAG
jgi:alkanesulfonate monooxygenase SsuD/methylene tetrahydromethanopterin reductase-like flavin-dependent oxidoreductase (luciferase family)